MAEQRSYTGSFDNRWKFNGKELDEETGLYYYGARFYNPSTSIWLSVDPLVEETFEPYNYVGNNPIRFIDPTGMNKVDPKKSAYERAKDKAYNPKTGNTDLVKLFYHWVKESNTYKKITDKDITSTATSENGGEKNQKGKGKKLDDNINGDGFLTAAPGSEKTGNKLITLKDKLEAANDVKGLFDKGQQIGEGINEEISKAKSKSGNDMIYVVKDDKNSNNNIAVRKDYYDDFMKDKEKNIQKMRSSQEQSKKTKD